MIYVVFILTAILWITVSLLCINSFNDFCNCEDEWEAMPLWFKFPAFLLAPIWFIWWMR